MKHKRSKILGVNVDFGLSMPLVIKKLDTLIKQGKGSYLVATTNPFFVISAQEDKDFRKIINNAVLSLPDGIGILYGRFFLEEARKLKKSFMYSTKLFIKGIYCGLIGFLNKKVLGQTLTGVELSYALMQLANDNKYTVFFLGGSPRDKTGNILHDSEVDIAQTAANNIMSLYPNICFIGATSAYKRGPSDDNNTMNYIHDCMALYGVRHIDILLVAYNPVGQEKWIHRNAKSIPATISVGVGRTLNYMAGDVATPPKIYENMHIAWLYALMIEPWRFGRVFKTIIEYPLKVYKSALK
ncbi:WecB/TagA/CpsF family glycosyltransferase [Patescibacteria group bacterium]